MLALGLAVIAVDAAAVDAALPGKMVVEKEESLSNEVLIEGMDEVLSAVLVGGLELKSILSKGVLTNLSPSAIVLRVRYSVSKAP